MEIYRVEIPQHIRKVQLSAKQRPQYYEWNGLSIKGKKPIPKRFFKSREKVDKVLIEDLKDNLIIGVFKDNTLISFIRNSTILPTVSELAKTKYKYRLCIDSGEEYIPILCNTKTVNTPRMYLIKGQDIYNGHLSKHMLGTIMDSIKRCYKPHIENLPVINSYPIRIECQIHDTIKNYYDNKSGLGQAWDIDNYAYPYLKAFPDIMQVLGKFRNDDRLHITQPPSALFVPIEDHNSRKLVFIVSKDERDIIANNEIYKSYHKNPNTYETEDSDLVKDDEPFYTITPNMVYRHEPIDLSGVKFELSVKKEYFIDTSKNKNKDEDI